MLENTVICMDFGKNNKPEFEKQSTKYRVQSTVKDDLPFALLM